MTGPDPVITPEHYRATLGHFCSGITVVTASGDDGPAGMTCQSFCSLSLDPPLILVCPGKGSSSWPRIAPVGSFAVNVLAEDQEELCRGFAAKGGDKFAGIGWSPGPITGSPVIAGSLAWIECRLEVLHDAGTTSSPSAGCSTCRPGRGGRCCFSGVGTGVSTSKCGIAPGGEPLSVI